MRGSVAATVLTAAARVLAFAFALVATRTVGAEGVARYSVVLAAATLGTVFADLGTSTAINRLVSRDPGSVRDLLGGTLLASTGVGAVAYAAGFAYFLLADTAADAGDWAIGGLQVVATSTLSSLTGALAGRGRLVRRAGVQFVAGGASFGGGALVLALDGSVDAALVALAAGPAVAVVAAVLALRRSDAWPRRLGLSRDAVAGLLKESLPFAALAAMAVVVSRADLLVLAVLSTAEQTARYELAVRSVEGLGFVTLALSPSAVYLLSRRLAAGELRGAQRAAEALHHTLLVAGVGLSALVAPLAWPLAALVYGDELRGVGTSLAILAAGLWVAFRVAAQGILLTSSEVPARVIPLGLAMVGVNLVLMAVLLPSLDAPGAAWATVGTQVVATALYSRTAARLTGVRVPLPSPRVLLPGVCAALAVLALRDLPLPVPLAVGAATYGGLLLALGGLRRGDLQRLRNLVRPS